jgi:hypothetical protein
MKRSVNWRLRSLKKRSTIGTDLCGRETVPEDEVRVS